jgi:hypothetical protein
VATTTCYEYAALTTVLNLKHLYLYLGYVSHTKPRITAAAAGKDWDIGIKEAFASTVLQNNVHTRGGGGGV